MILSDVSIREAVRDKQISIEPFDSSKIQPASIDVRLDDQLLVFDNTHAPFVDLRNDTSELTHPVELDSLGFTLHPGEFILGSTYEIIGVGSSLVARVEGKSSLGRLGLLIHSTAGYVDPGWYGKLTLELSNISRLPFLLFPYMPIAQISFVKLTTPALHPYGSPGLGSHYHGDLGPRGNKLQL